MPVIGLGYVFNKNHSITIKPPDDGGGGGRGRIKLQALREVGLIGAQGLFQIILFFRKFRCCVLSILITVY